MTVVNRNVSNKFSLFGLRSLIWVVHFLPLLERRLSGSTYRKQSSSL